VKFVGLTTN